MPQSRTGPVVVARCGSSNSMTGPGLKNSDVAEIIGTTEYVVKNYLRVIYDKLGLWNRVEIALWYEARRHETVAQGEP